MHWILFLVCAVPIALYTPSAYAQYFGDEIEPLTQEQKDYCEQHQIDPCTQNNILAKEKLFQLAVRKPFDWITLGIVIGSIVAIVGVVVVVVAVKSKKN